MIQKIIQRYNMHISVTHGCQVNLRHDQDKRLVRKGWKLMTTHKRLAEMMDLGCRCPKGYRHGACEGSMTRKSAYYTPEYAKRFCKAIMYEMTRDQLFAEMNGRPNIHERFGEGLSCMCQDMKQHSTNLSCGSCLASDSNPATSCGHAKERAPDSVSDPATSCGHAKERAPGAEAYVGNQSDKSKREEMARINKQLYLLHAATGHCSTRNMVLALQKRGAPSEVIEAAKRFRCSICEEKGKLKPRQVASLEPLPPKFATICADGGNWTHPETGETVGFVVIIDEGSRFRIARILSEGKRQTMSASQFLQYLQEG